MSQLPLGKLPKDVLISKVLRNITYREDVLLPPAYGEDGAVTRVSGNIIVAASDPITGASEEAGWLSVHVNANDIAVHAAYPKWYLVTLLFPMNTEEGDIEKVMLGIKKGLEEINASLIGGHSEITNRVSESIIIGTMIGEPMVAGKFVTSSGARPGDMIILTKGAGIEGTFILATDFEEKLFSEIDESIIRKAKEFRDKISILPEVRILTSNLDLKYIHAMHDVTEGGLLGGVYELAYASNVGFEIFEENILIPKETKEICRVFDLDPLKLISSGSLLIAIDKTVAEDAVSILVKKGIPASIIGHFTEERKMLLVKKTSEKINILEPPVDELWRILSIRSI